MKFWIGMSAIFIAMTSVVHALEIQKINGHEVSIKEDDFDKVLQVDGLEMHRNMYVSLEEMATVSGVPVIVGSSSNGGNACDSSPFVLSVPSGTKAQFDGPLDSCSTISHTIEANKIIFKSLNVPGSGQMSWEWTPESGFKNIGTTAFEASDKSGWNALRQRAIQYPWDVFDNIEINSQLENLVGKDFSLLQKILTGPGSGKYIRGDYFGSACASHSCGYQEAIIFLSQDDRKIFVALKPNDEKIRVYPPVKEWPKKAKYELKNWASKWK